MATPRKIACRLERITCHGDHVYTLDLEPSRTLPRFRPGQFLHLAIDPFDPGSFWPESRAFSIASAPTDRNHLRITYSVQGAYTRRMEQEIQQGCTVWVKLPYGEFVVEGAGETVLLAGGTGITAFMAYIRDLAESGMEPVHLVYGTRKPSLLAYLDEIDAKSRASSAFTATVCVEEAPPDRGHKRDVGTHVTWREGRISVDAVWESLSSPSGATYYIAGPPVMIDTLSQDLGGRGVDSARIRIDAWE